MSEVRSDASGPSLSREVEDLCDGALLELLERLHSEMRMRHEDRRDRLVAVHPRHRQSAANLVDYLTLRSHDLRNVQQALARRGLSSLGRSEEHVITTLERVIGVLKRLTGSSNGKHTETAVGFRAGAELLAMNADSLLGRARAARSTRVMVTMPTEAAMDIDLVRRLHGAGMDCARINCATDDESTWAAIAANVRLVDEQSATQTRLSMDLPGPKIRTGPIVPGPPVVRLRPRRDKRGLPRLDAHAVLVPDGPDETWAVRKARPASGIPCYPTEPSGPAAPEIPVPSDWLARRRVGEALRLRDCRGAQRVLRAVSRSGGDLVVESHDTTYIETGTVIMAPRGDSTRVGALPMTETALELRPDDHLVLSSDLAPAEPDGHPLRIGVTLPDVIDALQPGQRVFFDDGRIGGVVTARRAGEAEVTIHSASATGSKLRANKGINLPDSALDVPSLTERDIAVLPFVVGLADIVSLSFAQEPLGVRDLLDRLEALGGGHLGVVLKIETRRGFEALPDLLLELMRWDRIGVMLARGDLAVECGFERLAEVQEEILWLCDAAHVPVIWATEVLDHMARTGRPTRAEISDAVMAGRAECVMLNKGPFAHKTVAALDDILRRMSGHRVKKTSLLRSLSAWNGA